MRAVIQRVTRASVTIEEKEKTKIGNGFLVLLGIEDADSTDDVSWLAGKIAKLRVFSDAEGLMNLSLDDIHGDIIVVSQFTLFAATKKGNRPSYIRAARPEKAIPLYEYFKKSLSGAMVKETKSGIFGADMQVSLINDGPVTIIIDTKENI